MNILGSYLSCRKIIVRKTDGSIWPREVSCGVFQGSVLELDLWNILYDDLLKIQLPEEVELIAFADDVAVIATASVTYLLEEKLEEVLGKVARWMESIGLELAIDKTEAILLINRNKHNTMTVRFRPHCFPSTRSVKYLGAQLDTEASL